MPRVRYTVIRPMKTSSVSSPNIFPSFQVGNEGVMKMPTETRNWGTVSGNSNVYCILPKWLQKSRAKYNSWNSDIRNCARHRLVR